MKHIAVAMTCLLVLTSAGLGSVQESIPSVCYIQTFDAAGHETGSGSAVICTSNGIAATCFHVIDGAGSAKATLHDGTVVDVLGFTHADTKRDFAIIRLDDSRKYQPMAFGNSSSVKPGDKVFTIGNPRGLKGTLADGIVSAVRQMPDVGQVIQTTAPISPGSSGGALTDETGRLIGITKFYWKESQNLNFATPFEAVRPHLRTGTLTAFSKLPKSEHLVDVAENIQGFFNLIAEGGAFAKIAFAFAGEPSKLKADSKTFPLYVIYLSEQNDLRTAQQEITQFLKSNEMTDDLRLAISYFYWAKAQLEKDLQNKREADRLYRLADKYAFTVLKKDKTKPLACALHMLCLLGTEQYKNLEQNSVAAVRTFPNSLFPWRMRMFSLALVGRYDDAIAFSDRLLRQETMDKGALYYWRGRFQVLRISNYGYRDTTSRRWAMEAALDFKKAADNGNPWEALKGLDELQGMGF